LAPAPLSILSDQTEVLDLEFGALTECEPRLGEAAGGREMV